MKNRFESLIKNLREEVDEVICWLTGYNPHTLADQIKRRTDLETFFREAPVLHPNAS